MHLGSSVNQEKNSQAHFYKQETFTEMVEKFVEPESEIIEIPVLSPKMSMLCSNRTFNLMEQEIIDDSVIEQNLFKKSLEVITEQSMEIHEERDEPNQPKMRKKDSILEEDQDPSVSSPSKPFGSMMQEHHSKYDEDLLNLIRTSIQEDKSVLISESGPSDIFSESLILSEYEQEIDQITVRKDRFKFQMPKKF